MSVTPSGLSERFPIRRLPRQGGSNLNKDLSPDKHDKKNSEKSPLYEFDPTGLVQRCVIIQRDENGFGLTVSGDNPVFVQSVKEDGAAVRAGVQQGDRIIKVNGSLVTHSNHVEVVRLIKSGSYVALTVLGRPPGSPQIPLTATDGDPGTFFFPGQQGAISPNPTFSPHSPSSSCPDRITSPMPVTVRCRSSVSSKLLTLESQTPGDLSPNSSISKSENFLESSDKTVDYVARYN
ncbi:rho guanine nucleotide exchange factor 12-like [Scyliorhinus torazame]|uniref:rho guanine nucleotide exchange factor 12-like n=1 Tax=Scyliorhinus torazame TaxID=75743 RepID=UPI003B59104F